MPSITSRSFQARLSVSWMPELAPRAPKGFVICYDEKGDPFALPKKLAMMLKMWRPAKKPPISVGDWQAVKRADRTVSKMKKIFAVTTRVDNNISGGKVKVRRRKGGK